jgi:hypothetical protein
MQQKKNSSFVRTFFHNFFVLFLALFATLISVYVLTSMIAYGAHSISFVYIITVAAISLVLSVFLAFFLMINKIAFGIQIIVVYIGIMISMYVMGFITKVFRFSNIRFTLFTVIGNAIALLILCTIFLIREYFENKKLNENLLKFKERDRHEKK